MAPAPRMAPPASAQEREQLVEQTRKACRYYGRALERNGTTVVALELDGVTIVVARGARGEELRRAVEERGIARVERPGA